MATNKAASGNHAPMASGKQEKGSTVWGQKTILNSQDYWLQGPAGHPSTDLQTLSRVRAAYMFTSAVSKDSRVNHIDAVSPVPCHWWRESFKSLANAGEHQQWVTDGSGLSKLAGTPLWIQYINILEPRNSMPWHPAPSFLCFLSSYYVLRKAVEVVIVQRNVPCTA